MKLPLTVRPPNGAFWSPAAGRSWEKAAIPKLVPERQVLPQANIQRVSERLPTAAATGPEADWQVLSN
ncbi:hypothetical protein [uncultured Sphingomonas sp.]|uniref:hypothetical protein n=1 Tax=uncultured Sphingomonas sp. TaxID=158754 RepID=UPI0025D27AAA|nr:hypothetical protein [uncultured Sphingomonas sp.]